MSQIEGLGTSGVPAGMVLSVQTPDNSVASSALGVLNAAISILTLGLSGVGVNIAAGNLIATLIPEISYNGGLTWVPTLFYNAATQSTATSLIFSAANTDTNLSIVLSGGVSNARVRVSSYTSGTANATLRATVATSTTITTFGGAVSTGSVFSSALLNFSLLLSGSENPIFLIKNPTGNAKSLYFQSAYFGINTANRLSSFEVYANPVVTLAGTAVTPVNRSIGSVATSSMTLTTSPTIASNGSLISTIVLAQNASSISILDSFNLKILPGQSILITGNPANNATLVYGSITWSET